MTTAPSAVTRESFAEGLMQAFDVLGELAGIAWDVSEAARVRAGIVVTVHSEAEVDAAAAVLGAVPERLAPGHYRAVKRTGAVTVSVAACGACEQAGSTS